MLSRVSDERDGGEGERWVAEEMGWWEQERSLVRWWRGSWWRSGGERGGGGAEGGSGETEVSEERAAPRKRADLSRFVEGYLIGFLQ